jgi:hypothetical protein
MAAWYSSTVATVSKFSGVAKSRRRWRVCSSSGGSPGRSAQVASIVRSQWMRPRAGGSSTTRLLVLLRALYVLSFETPIML